MSITSSCSSVKELNYKVSEQKHHPKKLIADIDFVHRLLSEGHPGVYWYTEKEVLDAKFDSLKSTIVRPLSSKELYQKLAPIVAEVKCGHTRLLLVSKKYNKRENDSIKNLGIKPISQFSYQIIDDQIYITKFNSNIKNVKKGNELIAIDDVPTSTIVKNMRNYIPSDGYNQTFKNAVLNRAFTNWYTAIYDNNESKNFKIKNLDSITSFDIKTYKKEIKKDSAIVKKKVKKIVQDKKVAKEKIKSRYKGSDENKKPLLELNFLTNDSSVAYLKVKSFSFPYANFSKFYKESFALLKKGKTKDLILDLRDNGGGSLNACRNLFSYLVEKDFVYLSESIVENKFNPYRYSKGFSNGLKQFAFSIVSTAMLKEHKNGYQLNFKGIKPLHPNTNHYDGKVYVLINGYSFSAAALLASNLQQIKRATFVGQETGGGYNGCVAGQIPIIDLPNSGLKLRMGLYKVIPNAHTDVIGRGVFPDVEIKSTIDDVVMGKDRELEWVLNNIKTKS